jgi:hypothetical protein
VEPRWFWIFIYVTIVPPGQPSTLGVVYVGARYAGWRRFFPGFIRCACFVDCFFRRAFGARCDASFNRLVAGY